MATKRKILTQDDREAAKSLLEFTTAIRNALLSEARDADSHHTQTPF